jgi:hypothetical protein
MKKNKADPQNPPLEDLQGHTYQHELGDPDRARDLERGLNRHREPEAGKRDRSGDAKEQPPEGPKAGGDERAA